MYTDVMVGVLVSLVACSWDIQWDIVRIVDGTYWIRHGTGVNKNKVYLTLHGDERQLDEMNDEYRCER